MEQNFFILLIRNQNGHQLIITQKIHKVPFLIRIMKPYHRNERIQVKLLSVITTSLKLIIGKKIKKNQILSYHPQK